jgi:hypothetical protein
MNIFLKSLIKKIILESDDIVSNKGVFYSEYYFDDIQLSKKTEKYNEKVFFNGIKNTTDDFDIRELKSKEGVISYIPFVTFTKDDESFEFPAEKVKLVKNNKSAYVNLTDFRKKYKNYKFESDSNKLSINDVASQIKTNGRYKKIVNELLKEIYSAKKTSEGLPMWGKGEDENCETNVGVINFKGVQYGVGNKLTSVWSILNYFNTNTQVIKFLLVKFLEDNEINFVPSNYEDSSDKYEKPFLSWLAQNGRVIFDTNSPLIDEMAKLNYGTLKDGITNEQIAVQILSKVHNTGEGGITEFCPGSIQDTRYGRDMKINDENIYYQAKPFKGLEINDEGNFIVRTHSMKDYGPKVDRIIFVKSLNEYVIFDNKNYKVIDYGGRVVFNNPPIINKAK